MSVSKMSGTPWHIENLKKDEDDDRRHKANCTFYSNKKCTASSSTYYRRVCGGSAHCSSYILKDKTIKKIETWW